MKSHSILSGVILSAVMLLCPHISSLSDTDITTKCPFSKFNQMIGNLKPGLASTSSSSVSSSSSITSESEKYVISVAVEAGLGDRIIGSISAFYLALLSGRQFKMVTYGLLPAFQDAFSSPFINWTAPNFPDKYIENLKFTTKGQRGYGGDRRFRLCTDKGNDDAMMNFGHGLGEGSGSQPSSSSVGCFETAEELKQYLALFLVNNDAESNRIYVQSDLSAFESNVKYLIVSSNRGRTMALFSNNTHHRTQLQALGLTQETMFLCGYHYLFKPNYHTKMFANEFLHQMKDPDIIKIGLQIRVGDAVYKHGLDQRVEPSEFFISGLSEEFILEAFTDCALELEKEIFAQRHVQHASTNEEIQRLVRWLVISDSMVIRRMAKQKFGDKVITDLSSEAAHIDCGYIKPSNCNAAVMKKAMVEAAGHLHALSHADFHIVSFGSGYGRVGALTADHVGDHVESGGAGDVSGRSRVWSIQAPDFAKRTCTLSNSDSYEFLGTTGAGI